MHTHCTQEEKSRLKAGSLKAAVFDILNTAGVKGVSLDELYPKVAGSEGLKVAWKDEKTGRKALAAVSQ